MSVIVIPVKGGVAAKSRLASPVGVDHTQLALAMALDTVASAVATAPAVQVIVVTGDPVAADEASLLGARVVADPGRGLSAAIDSGLAACPVDSTRTVLLGDLPAATPLALTAALALLGEHARAFVPDLAGTGTTMLTAGPAQAHAPCFGRGSAAAHERAGYLPVTNVSVRLRRDVDDAADLAEAVRLGVGPRTAALIGDRLLG